MDIDIKKIKDMPYVEFMAFLDEINRPPGGKVALKKMLDYCDVDKTSKILDIGCNTGFCSFESVLLKNCQVVGIDLSTDMIKTANKKLLEFDKLVRDKISFFNYDAKKMPFLDNEFDFIFSGGSTAFIDDIDLALLEYKRVLKSWGFFGDINFFYSEKPREGLIDELNELMGTNIVEWNKEMWIEKYIRAGFEVFDILEEEISYVDDNKIEEYVYELLSNKNEEVKKASSEKLKNIMELFNENHKFLKYGIFIMRKREIREEPYLFKP